MTGRITIDLPNPNSGVGTDPASFVPSDRNRTPNVTGTPPPTPAPPSIIDIPSPVSPIIPSTGSESAGGGNGGGTSTGAPETPSAEMPEGQIDVLTAELFAQLFGLFDQTADLELQGNQISQLNSILNQDATLAGKDLAAGGFATGSAQPANISAILRGKSTALASGVTDIQAATQARIDENAKVAIAGLLDLRGQMSDEQQNTFNNSMAVARLDYDKWLASEGLNATEEEQDSKFWEFLTDAALAVAGFFV
jgi:hypothetical protein